MMAFGRPKSLQDYLVRAKLRPFVQNPSLVGTEGLTNVRVIDAMYVIILL